MKKLISLLLAVLMLLAVTAPAMAYEAVTPSNATINHTLELTDENAVSLPYNITYHFSITGDPTPLLPSGDPDPSVADITKAINGTPRIESAEYVAGSQFENNMKTTTLKVDLSAVKVMEPGIYRWGVTKTLDTNAPKDDPPTNNMTENAYLYLYVIDNAGALGIGGVIFTNNRVPPTDTELDNFRNTKGSVEDQYPAKTLDLSISKTVSGNQGSRNQYFEFTVKLTSPDGATHPDYTITITENEVELDSYAVPETAYNAAKVNPQVFGKNEAEIVLWLKHGQKATIKNLLNKTDYQITEGSNAGYDVSWKLNNGNDNSGSVATGTLQNTKAEVAFTNNKATTVPTGIELQTIAPIMGILLAAGMMMILFAGKKKETVR